MGSITPELIRYATVGLVVNSACYGVYAVLTSILSLSPKFAMTIVYCCGLLAGYGLHKAVSFSGAEHVNNTFSRFIISHFLGYGFNLLLLRVLVDYLEFSHLAVQGLATISVAILLFLLMKYYVFQK